MNEPSKEDILRQLDQNHADVTREDLSFGTLLPEDGTVRPAMVAYISTRLNEEMKKLFPFAMPDEIYGALVHQVRSYKSAVEKHVATCSNESCPISLQVTARAESISGQILDLTAAQEEIKTASVKAALDSLLNGFANQGR